MHSLALGHWLGTVQSHHRFYLDLCPAVCELTDSHVLISVDSHSLGPEWIGETVEEIPPGCHEVKYGVETSCSLLCIERLIILARLDQPNALKANQSRTAAAYSQLMDIYVT
jgi:hypothetical protein